MTKKTIKASLGEHGLHNYLGEVVSFERDKISLDGILRFGDVRDKGIVDDRFRRDRNEVYYVVGPTRWSSTPKGISQIATKSRQYEAWNILLRDNDIITVLEYSKWRWRTYKVKNL